MITDLKDRIIWVNESFTKITGFNAEEVHLKKPRELFRNRERNPELDKQLSEQINRKKPFSFEIQNLDKAGNPFWLYVTVTPIVNEYDRIEKFVTVGNDITKRKNTEALIKRKNRQIDDSIRYAKRIQDAVLVSDQYLDRVMQDYFILFLPRDVISGDFYWAYQTPDEKLIVSAVDCTGHGVPGAFMSMIGHMLMNEIIIEKKEYRVDKILEKLRDGILNAFTGESGDVNRMDGMDVSLCVWDKKNNKLEYGGANTSLYFLRAGELEEIKGDRQPVGYYPHYKPFSTHSIDLEPSDVFYLFSDGFMDQFGGKEGKRLKHKAFKDHLLALNKLPMADQKVKLGALFQDWKGEFDQVDDVCLIGVRV